MEFIKLTSNYYLEIKKDNKDIELALDITNIKLKNIKKNKIFMLKIDFNTFIKDDYKKILKHLIFIKSMLPIDKIGIEKDSKKVVGYLINYDENNQSHNDFISAIRAIFYNNRYDRYNYIYDTVCDYLDSFFYGKNLCDFKNNKCGEKRNTNSTIGCCRHFKIKLLGPLTKLVPCEHLKEDYTCGAKCISCKLFTCDYLRKKGVIFKIKDILLLDVFFNPIQKYFIKYMVFTTKEKILKRLMIF